MGARHFPRDVNSHGHTQSPAQGDIGVAAMNHFSRMSGGKQNHHGDDTGAKQDQYEGAEKFGNQFRPQRRLRDHRFALPFPGICPNTAE